MHQQGFVMMRVFCMILVVGGCAAHVSEAPVGVDHRPYEGRPAYMQAEPGAVAARLIALAKTLRKSGEIAPGYGPSPLQTATGGGSFSVALPNPAPLANRVDAPAQPWQPQIFVPTLETPPTRVPSQQELVAPPPPVEAPPEAAAPAPPTRLPNPDEEEEQAP